MCIIGAMSMFTTAISFLSYHFVHAAHRSITLTVKNLCLKQKKNFDICMQMTQCNMHRNKNYIQLVFLYHDTLTIQRRSLNLFLDNIFFLPTITSAKESASIYEIQVTDESNLSQETDCPHSGHNSDGKKKSWKISYNFPYISKFQKKMLIFDKNQCSLKECQFECRI